MATSTLDIRTPAGVCKTQIFTPEGTGPWPAVIVGFDAGGQRPAMNDIAERIAKGGYLVAIPDLYHRAGSVFDLLPKDAPKDASSVMKIFMDNDLRAQWMTKFYASALSYENLRSDIGALLDTLEKRPDFGGRVGTTGYCMGGNISLRLATIFGDRIAATASFHGGGLVTPAPDSPHLRAASIKSRVYCAGAIEDDSFTDDAKKQLDEALTAANVNHTIETYPAKHGFAVSDNPTYDAAAAERHFEAMSALFSATLR